MRLICLVPLLIAACSGKNEETLARGGVFGAAGRDRLCIKEGAQGSVAGLIVYGEGNQNCSASGRLERSASGWTLVPRGEGECRIALRKAGAGFAIANATPACDYYCGAGVSLAGKSFEQDLPGAEATDFAGDPLC